ncbi:protein BRAWNIN [Homalodisca vitripennis]|uniref:protein BRAWNIN n=1 Tax=Homalodisca vitripennis TaxID=197043 RepID=UPI001EECA7C5|nr:protein BRAWNIN [Homalodisca vitripennis]KAG8273455.1 hypothetical protein J6590_019162 [Homalodisca vitripennis]KAG8273458.1 hypothetical protein J6590_019164 [Homalodisca vitripennis]
MPAGVPWSTYLKFVAAASVSMIVGAQAVHAVYRPLDDLDELVREEIERLKKEREIGPKYK